MSAGWGNSADAFIEVTSASHPFVDVLRGRSLLSHHGRLRPAHSSPPDSECAGRSAAQVTSQKISGSSLALPVNSGSRFSRKAATPSLPSPMLVWNIARLSARWASSGWSTAPLR